MAAKTGNTQTLNNIRRLCSCLLSEKNIYQKSIRNNLNGVAFIKRSYSNKTWNCVSAGKEKLFSSAIDGNFPFVLF